MSKQTEQKDINLGALLKTYRKKSHVTQQEIADATGLTKNYISSVERGVHQPSATTLFTYARICNFSLDELANIIPRSKVNKKNRQDGLELLASIGDEVVSACFFDPQYHALLDKMQYGNLGVGREKARFELPQMEENIIIQFITEIDRVLHKNGYLFLWIEKYQFCEGIQNWLTDTSLKIVDTICWDKGQIGMGYRTRSRCEYLIILQRPPANTKTWIDHAIPDVWREKILRTNRIHPHTKPVGLIKRLITATTDEGDYVLDPASGSYIVLDACKALNRHFIGCDIQFGDM